MSGDYPTDDDLARIKAWPVSDCAGLFDFVQSIWSRYGDAAMEDGTLRLVTGGWSGNEDVINAMGENMMVWTMCWQSSHRGGLYTFKPWTPEPADA